MPLFLFASGYVYIATIEEIPLVLFCIEQFKKMLVFFMFGIIAFEHIRLHSFIKDFKVKQSVIISVLFAVCQYIQFGMEKQGAIICSIPHLKALRRQYSENYHWIRICGIYSWLKLLL